MRIISEKQFGTKGHIMCTTAHLLAHQGGWTTRWGDQMFMPYVGGINIG
ncbi:MAG: hypothetical protein R2744_08085 [Bacteroidales bacterium]